MTAELQRKLERLKYYATRYEVTMAHADGRRYLVLYTEGRSRSALVRAVRQVGEAIVAVTGASEFQTGRKAADGIKVGGFTINFSGRTQRDAYIEGELPFVSDTAKASA